MKSVRLPMDDRIDVDGLGMNDLDERFISVSPHPTEQHHAAVREHTMHPHPHPHPPVRRGLLVKSCAEFLGTLTLVLFGAGSVVLPPIGVTNLQIALSFGLTLLFLVYAIGPISGCHVNPAVSIGVYVSYRGKMDKRGKDKFSTQELIAYWLAQFLGGITGAAILYGIVCGRMHYDIAINGLGENGWGMGYADHYNMPSAFLAELIFTFIFIVNILVVTRSDSGADPTVNGLSIGITLAAIHLACLPITGVSLNPARSFAVAIFVGGIRLRQVWLFFVATPLGAILAAILFRWMDTLKQKNMEKPFFEFLGTFTLVLIGVGSVVFPVHPDRMSTAFAFGFALVSIAFGFGPISGAHVNPAVTFALWLSRPGTLSKMDVLRYWIAQFLGGFFGALMLYAIVYGRHGYSLPVDGLGVNGWGPGYAEGFKAPSAFFFELVFTFVFLVNIIGSTGPGSTPLAGLSIGLTLGAIHIAGLPISGTSVNPARSLGPALIVGGKSLRQLSVFFMAPMLGAAFAGVAFRFKVFGKRL